MRLNPRITGKHCCKILALVVAFLYIFLWFTKTNDKEYDEMANKHKKSDAENIAKVMAYGHLTVVSYNMWCNYLVISKANYVDRVKGLAKGLKYLVDVDVVFLQEIFILRAGPLEFSRCATLVADTLAKKGFIHKTSFTSTVPYLFGQNSGVAIFSKIPFTNTSTEIFKHADTKESVNNKGFASAEIVINNKKITLFTAHTDAHNELIRTLQLKQLASAIKKHQDTHVIVGGDFNINPNNPPKSGNKLEYNNLLQTMNDVGLKTAFPECKKTYPDGGCYDYFFVSSDMTIAKSKLLNFLTYYGEKISDHYGLFIKVKL